MGYDCYIGIGSNSGNRMAYLRYAQSMISSGVGVVLKSSSVYETAAWGNENQAPFLNQVLRVKTILSPDEILYELLQIEKKAGRTREVHWGPRTLDLDILGIDRLVIESQSLTVPHPRISERKFVLIPWQELEPAWKHPVSGRTIQELLQDCPDTLPVKLWINH